MNIGIDVRSLLDKNYSGVGEYTYQILKALFEIDSRNHYFLFYNSANPKLVGNLPKFEQKNVHYCRFKYPNKLLNLCLFIFNFPKIDILMAKKYRNFLGGEKIDIFFTPNINFIALSKNCRHIVTVHDLSFEKFPEFYDIKGRIWHKLANFQRIIENCNLVVAVSKNTKNDLIDLYKIRGSKITVIHSGIDNDFEIIKDSQILEKVKLKYNLSDDFILYLGNLEPRKNIESIIEAFSLLKTNTKLVIAGGEGWKNKSIYKTIKDNNLKDRVIFTGYVNKDDKPALYNLAKVFVYPSYYEGFGFPPLEAFACGIPVITSYSSSLSEVAGDAALMVDPYNINDIYKAMNKLLLDDSLRDDLKNRGLELSKNYNWKKTAEKFLKEAIYQQK